MKIPQILTLIRVSQAKILNDIINKKLFTIRINSFLLVSLLSDSNQRPRDYKSRALAN